MEEYLSNGSFGLLIEDKTDNNFDYTAIFTLLTVLFIYFIIYEEYNNIIEFHEDATKLDFTLQSDSKLNSSNHSESYAQKYLKEYESLPTEYKPSEDVQSEIERVKNDMETYVLDNRKRLQHLLDILTDANMSNIDKLKKVSKTGYDYSQCNQSELKDEVDISLFDVNNQLQSLIKYENSIQTELNKIKYRSFVRNYVHEMTPVGGIFMRYNHDEGKFDYFSDVTVPHKYLEVVARKYVITFNCREIYKEKHDTPEKSTFKPSVNTSAKNIAPKNRVIQPNMNIKVNLKEKTDEEHVKYTANVFSHRRLCDFQILNSVPKKQKATKLSYRDYVKKHSL